MNEEDDTAFIKSIFRAAYRDVIRTLDENPYFMGKLETIEHCEKRIKELESND